MSRCRSWRRGRHYIRDGSGAERIYDLKVDPYETTNLIGSAPGDKFVVDFRRMLKKLLTNNPGSIAVENAYLKAYRQWLESSVDDSQTERGVRESGHFRINRQPLSSADHYHPTTTARCS